MTDYYAVLKRAVGGLEHEAVDVRRAIYDRARAALLGQLKGIDPPLDPSEISRQRLELEEAIRRVEREAAMTAAGPSPARVRAAAAQADALAAQVMRSPDEDVGGDGAEYSHAAETPPPPRPVSRATPVASGFRPGESRIDRNARPISADASRIAPPARVPAEPPMQDWSAADQGDAPARMRSPDRRDARHVAPPEHYADEARDFDPVQPIAPDEQVEWPADSNDETLLAPPDEPVREKRRAKRPPAAQVERAGRSRLPLVLVAVVALLAIGAAAAAVWSQRSKVGDIVGGLMSSDTTPAPASGSDADASAAASAKNADRLGGSAQDAPRTVRTVNAEPLPEEGDPLAGVVQPGGSATASDGAAATPATAPSADASTGASDAATAAAPAAGADGAGDGVAGADKAILYEQPINGATNVTALGATVTWKYEKDPKDGPEIIATADIPDRQMKVTLKIRKNTNKAITASHLVEVLIDTPQNFPGGSVREVPALVMKPTEESRGVPLDGAAAKVLDGYFWIGLAADGPTETQNVALLKDRNWIDLPLQYDKDNQRAILTLEKGPDGQSAFKKAFAAWGD